MLTNIKINELYAHPQNPRKDIGDITELAESIKNQGIFQNLTVVKGGAGVPEGQDGYTVIIGHRRLAAAKIAGLEELPCLVAQMDEKQQVATMLLENMQRSDLTIYEQAQGFQMMLDLGETQQSIAEKTGFSQTTVHRRLELVKLDQKKLEAAAQRQISILDLDKLSQIESIEKRNELLKDIGTPNFQYCVKSAIDKEKQKKREDEWRQVLLDAGLIEIEEPYDSKYGYCKRSYLGCSTNASEYVRADDEKYFKISYGGIYFRKDRDESKTKEDIEREKELEKANARMNSLRKIRKRAFELREQFAQSVSDACIKKHLADIVAFWIFSASRKGCYFDYDDIIKPLDIEPSGKDEDEDEYFTYDDIFKNVRKSPEKYAWKMICIDTDDSESEGYFAFDGSYEENETLTAYYDLLVKMGYEMSDEEKQLRDGTHPLFWENAKNEAEP